MMNDARENLRALVEEKCLTTGRSYILSTGQQSDFYFDCKRALLNGRCLSFIADAFLEEAAKLSVFPEAVGGLTMGADFIVAAVIQRAFENGNPMVHGSIVRKEPKMHGTGNRIENELESGTCIMVVDDVVTTGSSTDSACTEYVGSGYKIAGIVVLVDREAGGLERLAEKYGCPVSAIFRKKDFPSVGQNANTASGQFSGMKESGVTDSWNPTASPHTPRSTAERNPTSAISR